MLRIASRGTRGAPVGYWARPMPASREDSRYRAAPEGGRPAPAAGPAAMAAAASAALGPGRHREHRRHLRGLLGQHHGRLAIAVLDAGRRDLGVLPLGIEADRA